MSAIDPGKITFGPVTVTNPAGRGVAEVSAGGSPHKYVWAYFDKAVKLTLLRGGVRTQMGSGTIEVAILNGGIDGTGTARIGSIPVTTTWGANTTVVGSLVDIGLARNGGTCQLIVQVGGDGTLDGVDLVLSANYVHGDPASQA